MMQNDILREIERLFSGPRGWDVISLANQLVYAGRWVEACEKAVHRRDPAVSPWRTPADTNGPLSPESPMEWALSLCAGCKSREDPLLEPRHKRTYAQVAEAVGWCAALAHAILQKGNAVPVEQIRATIELFRMGWWWPTADFSIRAAAQANRGYRWIEHGIPEHFAVALRELDQTQHDWPLAPFYDLMRLFIRSPKRQPREHRHVQILVPIELEIKNIGLIADLRLDLVPEGTGLFYPDPCRGVFFEGDEHFLSACRNAWDYTRPYLDSQSDIKWSLTLRLGPAYPERTQYDCFVEGPSVGAAFAVALLALSGRKPGSIHSMRALTGAIRNDGTLVSVEGYQAKLAAAESAAVNRLVYPEANQASVVNQILYHGELRAAATVEQAFDFMVAERPGQVPPLRGLIIANEYDLWHSDLLTQNTTPAQRQSDVYLVERSPELQVCEERLIALGHVCLTGRPGAGKTSLARMLIARISPTHDESIFWRNVAEVNGVLDLLGQLAEFLTWHGSPQLGYELQLASKQETTSEQLAELIEATVVRLHNNKFVLCFDEIESVAQQPLLIDFFKYLVRRGAAGARIIFISRTHPSYISAAAEVRLPDGMGTFEARALVTMFAPELTEEQIRNLVEVTAGNPLLLSYAAPQVRDGKLGPEITAMRVAHLDEVQTYLLQTLDATLTSEERTLLFAIAVLQQVNPSSAVYTAIQAVTGREAIQNDLQRLTGANLLKRAKETTSSSNEAGGHIFCYQQHAIDHAFYYTHEHLGTERRCMLHGRAAHYYEQIKRPLLAALHHDLAGQHARAIDLAAPHLMLNDSPNSAEQWDIARSPLWKIINQGDSKALMRLLEGYRANSGIEARQRLRDLDDNQVIRVHLALGQLYLQQGNHTDARAFLKQGIRYLRHAEDSVMRHHAFAFANYLLADSWEHENPSKALKYIEQGIEALKDIGGPRLSALYYKQASILIAESAYEQAKNAINTGWQNDMAGFTRERAGAQLKLGAAYSYEGKHQEAIHHTEEAELSYQRIGDEWGLVGALHNLGIEYEEIGKWAKAQDYYEQALTIAERLDIVKDQLALHLSRGILFTKKGQPEAQDELVQAIGLAIKHGYDEHLVAAQASLATLLVRLGQWDAAETILIEARRRAMEKRIRSQLCEIDGNMALVGLAGGRLREALRYAKAALSRARRNDSLHEIGVALRIQGKVLAAQGLHEAAITILEESRHNLQAEPYEEALTLVQLGAIWQAQGKKGQAYDCYQTARVAFAQLGAMADLILVDENLAALESL